MLKYFSTIISKFSRPQRIVVLILLLVSSVTVILGPKIIEVWNHDDRGLVKRIEIQKNEIDKLNQEVVELNNKIRINQVNCTDQIIAREREILDRISALENIASVPEQPRPIRRLMRVMPPPPSGDGDNGTGSPVVKSLPLERIEEPMPIQPNVKLIKGLKDIKTMLQKSIDSKN